MSDRGETYQPVSVPEAAAILGVSVATVLRRIRDGSLRAETIHRPQGRTYVVLLASDHTSDHACADSDQQVGIRARLTQSPAPQAEAMVALIQATIATVLGPLVGQLDAHRQTIERQADELKELARENGRQAAELERAASTAVALSAENDALRASQPRQAAHPGPEVSAPTAQMPWCRCSWPA